MADSKTIISEAEEKMDMAVMYLDELRKHGAHQQCSGSNYS